MIPSRRSPWFRDVVSLDRRSIDRASLAVYSRERLWHRAVRVMIGAQGGQCKTTDHVHKRAKRG